jgi:PAS domain S-box-containing protein
VSAAEGDERFRAAIDCVSDAFYAMDRDYRLVVFNRAAEAYFGFGPEKIVGRLLWEVFPEGRDTPYGEAVERAMTRRERSQLRTESVLAPGRSIEMTIAPWADGVCVAIDDLTDRNAAQRRLRESEERLRFSTELAHRQRALREPAAIMESTSHAVARFLGANRAGFYRLVDDNTLYFDVSWTDGSIRTVTGSTISTEVLGEAYNANARAGMPIVSTDTLAAGDIGEQAGQYGARAGIAAPIVRQGRWESGFYLSTIAPRVWSPEEVTFIQEIAQTSWDAVERAEAEAEVRLSEERFRLVAESAPVMLWMGNQTGKCVYLNRAQREFWGVAIEDVPSFDWSTTIHPDDADAVGGPFIRGMETRTGFTVEGRYRRADGAWRLLSTQAQPRFGPRGEFSGMIGVNVDVTDARAAEQALRSETRRLAILNKTGAALAAELDLDRIVQLVTDACVELSGAEFGAFFYNVLDENGESYMLYALSGVPREAFSKFPMPRATDVFMPTFRGEGVVRADDILVDPRYGKNAPRKGMPEGHLPVRSYLAVPVTSRTGEVLGGLFFGHSKVAQFGAEHEGLVSSVAAQAAIAIDNARLFQAGERELAQRRDAELALSVLNATLEERVKLAVSEQKQAAEALEEARKALFQAQKMEAVGQLTGGIAHDFNNMLAGIIGAMHLLERRIKAGRYEETDKYISAALDSANRAAALTSRLLAFGRRQSLDIKPVDANAAIRAMEPLVRRTLNENVDLEMRLDETAPLALTDAHQLESAILNLALNARDAMPDGGVIVLSARLVRSEREAGRDLKPGEYVEVSVTDTGVGMDADVVARAFEPFFTTKPSGAGTGLGLSMVYGFAKQTGGDVVIASELGTGTTVRLFLPVAREILVQADQRLPATDPSGRGEVVLVVEDDPLVRMLVLDVLKDIGYAAKDAHDAQAAIPLIESDARIDLLISDVGLPGLNGRQLADIARHHRPDLRVLFLTGYAEHAAVRSGFLGVGMDLMTKPFAVDALAVKIKEMLDR